MVEFTGWYCGLYLLFFLLDVTKNMTFCDENFLFFKRLFLKTAGEEVPTDRLHNGPKQGDKGQ